LVLSKQLVELTGDSMRVESTAGVGSVFSIELNVTEAIGLACVAIAPTAVMSFDTAKSAPLRTMPCLQDNPAHLTVERVRQRTDVSTRRTHRYLRSE